VFEIKNAGLSPRHGVADHFVSQGCSWVDLWERAIYDRTISQCVRGDDKGGKHGRGLRPAASSASPCRYLASGTVLDICVIGEVLEKLGSGFSH
jgi:hypothetical protein